MRALALPDSQSASDRNRAPIREADESLTRIEVSLPRTTERRSRIRSCTAAPVRSVANTQTIWRREKRNEGEIEDSENGSECYKKKKTLFIGKCSDRLLLLTLFLLQCEEILTETVAETSFALQGSQQVSQKFPSLLSFGYLSMHYRFAGGTALRASKQPTVHSIVYPDPAVQRVCVRSPLILLLTVAHLQCAFQAQ